MLVEEEFSLLSTACAVHLPSSLPAPCSVSIISSPPFPSQLPVQSPSSLPFPSQLPVQSPSSLPFPLQLPVQPPLSHPFPFPPRSLFGLPHPSPLSLAATCWSSSGWQRSTRTRPTRATSKPWCGARRASWPCWPLCAATPRLPRRASSCSASGRSRPAPSWARQRRWPRAGSRAAPAPTPSVSSSTTTTYRSSTTARCSCATTSWQTHRLRTLRRRFERH